MRARDEFELIAWMIAVGADGQTSIIVCFAKCQSDSGGQWSPWLCYPGMCSRWIEGKINLGSLFGCKTRTPILSNKESTMNQQISNRKILFCIKNALLSKFTSHAQVFLHRYKMRNIDTYIKVLKIYMWKIYKSTHWKTMSW